MSDLFWPGDDRAGEHFTDAAFIGAMVSVEGYWLATLGALGIAPVRVGELDFDVDRAELGRAAEHGANPVIPLVEVLRRGLEQTAPDAAPWIHRGLTSQDVVDTALMLMARDAVGAVRSEVRRQVRDLARLAQTHRDTAMVARTLTQHAVPTTFGLKAAQWLTGVLDAADGLDRLTYPIQLGGAAGTRSAMVELGMDRPAAVVTVLAGQLGLDDSRPWHTTRAPVTRIGDALVGCTDAWGRIARDVLTLGRPEIGELSEAVGGGSSTMPQKANPVLSTMVRRAAMAAPQLGATLHVAAAEQVDERADGAWHAEWATLRTLARRTVVAASQTSDLLSGVQVHDDRMRSTLESARHDVLAEQRGIAELAGHDPTGDYVGAAGALVDEALDRARAHLEDAP